MVQGGSKWIVWKGEGGYGKIVEGELDLKTISDPEGNSTAR